MELTQEELQIIKMTVELIRKHEHEVPEYYFGDYELPDTFIDIENDNGSYDAGKLASLLSDFNDDAWVEEILDVCSSVFTGVADNVNQYCQLDNKWPYTNDDVYEGDSGYDLYDVSQAIMDYIDSI